MKNLKNNKKGFTLIELLAVIVILAILVAVAIPAVMRYLATSRQETFATNANRAIETVRTDVTFSGISTNVYYPLNEINKLLDKKLATSPYGKSYNENSFVQVTFDNDGNATYSICLTDGNYGINVDENTLDATKVTTGTTSCTQPSNDTGYTSVTVNGDGNKTTTN